MARNIIALAMLLMLGGCAGTLQAPEQRAGLFQQALQAASPPEQQSYCVDSLCEKAQANQMLVF